MNTTLRLMMLFWVLGLVFVADHALAVYEKKDGFPWNLTLNGDYDKPIVDKLGGGFFMNVGPTGIRAQITHEHPAFFTVKFVFEDSPAAGKIKPGDIIVGANGKVMTKAHQFGRRNVTGWDGPMVSMSILIEEAQGNDGKLDLIVWPGGSQKEKKIVPIQIKPVGRFSKTFPFDCPRSDKLMQELCDFLAHEYKRKGSFGRPHTHSASILALMASGDNKYTPVIREVMAKYPGKTYRSIGVGGFPCWGFGHDGIVMGEYYLLTKDKSIIPAAKSLAIAIAESQNPENGGYTHRPYPVIAERVANGGPKGYGPMAATTGLVMLGQSLFKVAGLDYSEECYQRLHQSYVTSWNDNGSLGYGMAAWDRAVIQLKGDSIGKATNKKGIGYVVPTGMEGIEQFEIIWPDEPNQKAQAMAWIRKEGAKAKVYVTNKNERLVVRDMSRPGPSKPIPNSGRPIGHIVRSGTAALAHGIGAEDQSWQHMANRYAQACANSPNAILDGHASTLMHTLWGSLGAARADEKSFRYYMDGMKWWFIMAQTHDGGFVCMPGRDYASTDHVYATRNFPTATAALILSVKEAKLQITGAGLPRASKPKSGDDQETPAKQPAPELAMLGSDFTPVHCVKEAELFLSHVPYARVLQMLDRAAAGQDDKAKEAAEFAGRIRVWLQARNSAFMQLADQSPGRAIARTREHISRLAGLDELGAAEARQEYLELTSDPGAKLIARSYDQLDQIIAQESEAGGPSAVTVKRRQMLINQTQALLAQPDLPERAVDDAFNLLGDLDGE